MSENFLIILNVNESFTKDEITIIEEISTGGESTTTCKAGGSWAAPHRIGPIMQDRLEVLQKPPPEETP